ncbi:MAG: right-handed parallel beta-helix repeat-containing protein [Deltaproteobacteria bacterium]|nr:right-handed parallel beta-helix repeat-containing protein [Deltaproteobacteria bacterium]
MISKRLSARSTRATDHGVRMIAIVLLLGACESAPDAGVEAGTQPNGDTLDAGPNPIRDSGAEDSASADSGGIPLVDAGPFETCNGRDDNANLQVDEGFPDSDGDGTADCVDIEDCDGRDNDGDGDVDEDFPDCDLDGTADCVEVFAVTSSVGARLAAAPNWNDYAAFPDESRACDPAAALTHESCTHGGERRFVRLDGICTCKQVSARDELGAFDWACTETGSGRIEIESLSLSAAALLSNLIDFETSSFRPNRLIVSDGTRQIATPPAVWWSNPIEATETDDTLSVPGTIYVSTSTRVRSFRLTADRVALVIQPGVVQRGAPTEPIVTASSVRHVWLEGSFSGGSTEFGGVRFDGVRHSRFRGVELAAIDGPTHEPAGIVLSQSPANRLEKLRIRDFSGSGLRLVASGGTLIDEGSVARLRENGISLQRSEAVTIKNAVLDQIRGRSIEAEDSPGLEIEGARLRGGQNFGIYLNRSPAARLDEVEIIGNRNFSIYLEESGSSSLTRVRLADPQNFGVYLSGSPDVTVWDLVVENGENFGFLAQNGSHRFRLGAARFSSMSNYGVLVNGDSTDGVVASTLAANTKYQGLIFNSDGHVIMSSVAISADNWGFTIASRSLVSDIGGSDNEYGDIFSEGARFFGSILGGRLGSPCGGNISDVCEPPDPLDAEVMIGLSLGSSFLGPLAVDDSANQSDSSGVAAYDRVEDWLEFENGERGWGLSSATWPEDRAARRRCTASTGPCQIYDFSLRSTDSILRARVPVPDGDAVLTHSWLASSEGECRLIAGATWDGVACSSTFLRGALERVGDGVGNENLLCESNEACLYTPNLGAYQGHGAETPLTFRDGQIRGVTLMGFAENGR